MTRQERIDLMLSWLKEGFPYSEIEYKYHNEIGQLSPQQFGEEFQESFNQYKNIY